jgi:hypothetical protein
MLRPARHDYFQVGAAFGECSLCSARRFVDGIAECLENCPSFAGIVIKGVPHNCLGHEPALAEELENWLRERTQVRA